VFIPQNEAIADGDLGNAQEFVQFWSQFYVYHIRILGGAADIDYIAELNLQHDLTQQNCQRLMRWKDPQFLTHQILNGPNQGQVNPRVERVLDVLPQINAFRNENLTEAQFLDCTGNVFPNGLVWQVFLFHIARPDIYPIADQHVFRTFCLHRQAQHEDTWQFYQQYRAYFAAIANACGIPRTHENVAELKEIDNALMVFGQFLGRYYAA